MKKDPAIDRIRKVRQAISKKFGHDPRKLVEHYMVLDKKIDSQKGRNKHFILS